MSGIERFMEEMLKLDLQCERRGKLVVVTMDVAPAGIPGPHLVGTDPPPDFPNVPPHWLHVASDLELPDGGGRASSLGPGWRRWSRKHPKWTTRGTGGQKWVAQVRSLLLAARKV